MKRLFIIFLTALTLFAGCNPDTVESEYDLTALDAKIAEAKLVMEGVQEAVSADDVAKNRKWVTHEDMTTFTAAIAFAVAIQISHTSQSAVDNAVTNLNNAIISFKSKIHLGNKENGFTQAELNRLVTEAENAKAAVKTSDINGADVIPKEYWVTSAIMTALANAITAAQNSSGNIDNNYAALVTALNNFYTNKKPGVARRSVTITSLPAGFSDGIEINVGLFADNNLILSGDPEIIGIGNINNNKAAVVLFTSSGGNTAMWTGNGSYYVAFMANAKTYISKEKINFSDTSPHPTVTYGDFDQYIYEYNFGIITAVINYPIPENGVTLNDFCSYMTGYTYAQMFAGGMLPGQLYKDRGLTQVFTGFETLTASTMIYCEFDLSILMSLGAGGS